MMIKITERCTMGCKHCMNDAKPDGHDMTIEILDDTLNFLQRYNIGCNIIITGGEPLEHRSFDGIIRHIAEWNKQHKHIAIITITTNGEMIAKDYAPYVEYIKLMKESDIVLMYQISADARYYPRRIPTHKRIFRESGFVLCDNCVEYMYPQGRARDNHLSWNSKASKCFNVRSIVHQTSGCSLNKLEGILMVHGKFCTPHIRYNGYIGLGESDLCPAVASIYDTEDEIISAISEFNCSGCDIINDRLPESLKQYIRPVKIEKGD